MHSGFVLAGYRSVPLKNSYSEDLELASLLVYMDIIKGRVRNFTRPAVGVQGAELDGFLPATSLPLSFAEQQENTEMTGVPLGASAAVSGHLGRDRLADVASLSPSTSLSPLAASPGQALAYQGREGSFEARYQTPLDEFRVSQEPLLDHIDAQNRRYAGFRARAEPVSLRTLMIIHWQIHH